MSLCVCLGVSLSREGKKNGRGFTGLLFGFSSVLFQGKNSREFLVYFGPSRRSEDLTSLRGDSIFRSLVG